MTSVNETASFATGTDHPELISSDGGGVLPVLQLDQVTKVYPTVPPVQALRGVSLTVQRGELVGIVGPSGSGKTTLLHLMGTLDRPSSGTVRLTGLDVATMADADLAALRATRIGFVFQQFFLAEHQTILDNVADGLLYAGVRQAERRERACEALDLVDLGSRLWSRPTQLSGGQRQRVAIARALVGDPAIVLADEPTGNLDQITGQAILSLLAQLHERGVTILVITHDRAIAERMPRRVEMLDGRIVYDTPTATSHGPATLDGEPPRAAIQSRSLLGACDDCNQSSLDESCRQQTSAGWPRSACAPASSGPPCPHSVSPSE